MTEARAVAMLRRLCWRTWRRRWRGGDSPNYLRANALDCRESCRKRAARHRRAARLARRIYG